MHLSEDPSEHPSDEVERRRTRALAREPAASALPPLESLESEGANSATRDLDRLSALDLVRVMNAEDATVAGAVARELPQIARAIEAIAARLARGGRLIYVGAGTSGRLGALDAAECPPTFNVSPQMVQCCVAGGPDAWTGAIEDAEDRADLGEADLAALALIKADAVVGIAASGHTPYVLGAMAYARAQGALTIGIACNANTPLQQACEIAITPLVGPEVIAGSTRLKAGTAQKMTLNMLSTGAMVQLGKTYGNLMVDVQPTNVKLRQRALRIVAQATGLDLPAAGELLERCGGEIKTALVAQLTRATIEEARDRLAAHRGVVRAAVESAPAERTEQSGVDQ